MLPHLRRYPWLLMGVWLLASSVPFTYCSLVSADLQNEDLEGIYFLAALLVTYMFQALILASNGTSFVRLVCMIIPSILASILLTLITSSTLVPFARTVFTSAFFMWLCFGSLSGFLQALECRFSLPGALVWVSVSALGWTILITIFSLEYVIGYRTVAVWVPAAIPRGLLGGFVEGSITGVGLLWVTHQATTPDAPNYLQRASF